MKEDIAELEIIITTIRKILQKEIKDTTEDVYTIDGRQFKALENLLTRYKQDSKLLEHMSKRFEEAIKDTYLLFKLWAVMEKDNISIRTLMEREMSGYYDSKIESEGLKI